MKTIKFKFIALLIVLAGIGGSCSVDDNEDYCFFSAYTATSSVAGPTTTTVNVPITLTVGFIPLTSCGAFKTFSEGTTFPKSIKVLADYTGCNCPATKTETKVPYIFTATTPGEYVLNFATATDIPKTITITVTE